MSSSTPKWPEKSSICVAVMPSPLPNMLIRAEDNNYEPIVGQTVTFAFPYPSSRSVPRESVTNERGETETLSLVLQGDTSGTTSNFYFTPYFVGNSPSVLAEKAIQAIGVDVDWVRPMDGEEALPMIGDPSLTYQTSLQISRPDAAPISPNLEVEVEFIPDGGAYPILLEGSAVTSHRWQINPEDPTINLPLVPTSEGPGVAFFFLRFYQRGALHGERMEMLNIQE